MCGPADPRHCSGKHGVQFAVITQPYLISTVNVTSYNQNRLSILNILALSSRLLVWSLVPTHTCGCFRTLVCKESRKTRTALSCFLCLQGVCTNTFYRFVGDCSAAESKKMAAAQLGELQWLTAYGMRAQLRCGLLLIDLTYLNTVWRWQSWSPAQDWISVGPWGVYVKGTSCELVNRQAEALILKWSLTMLANSVLSFYSCARFLPRHFLPPHNPKGISQRKVVIQRENYTGPDCIFSPSTSLTQSPGCAFFFLPGF